MYDFLTAGALPVAADKYKGALIILGSGQDVWKEYGLVKKNFSKYDVMAINMTYFGMEYLHKSGKEPLKHWASLHKDFFQFKISRGTEILTHSREIGPGVDNVWPVSPDGTSSLFALKIGLLMGYSKIILCGIPLDNSRRFYDPPWGWTTNNDPAVNSSWEAFAANYKGKAWIRAMSGKTKELFGDDLI